MTTRTDSAVWESVQAQPRTPWVEEAYQVTGIGHDEELPSLELRGLVDRRVEMIPGELAYTVASPRLCIGARPPGSHLKPCAHPAEPLRRTQCEACFAQSQILPCLRCDGRRCHNPPRREYCVPHDHALYLASFGPGLVKVGVARFNRRTARLREQGALAGIIIGHADGQSVRWHESVISRTGIADRIPMGERLRALAGPIDQEALRLELEQTAETLQRRLNGIPWLDVPEVIHLPEARSLGRRPELVRPEEGQVVHGAVIEALGTLVILDRDGEPTALDLGSLVGHWIRARHADDQLPEQQMSMDLGGN